MVVQLGILAATYIGARLYDQYRAKHHQRSSVDYLSIPSPPGKNLARGDHAAALLKHSSHHFKVSMVAVGLSLLAPLSPLFYLPGLAVILYSSVPVLKLGERQLLKNRTVGHDVLYSLFIILCFATQQELFLALGLFFYHAGSKLLAMNQARSGPMISNLLEGQPDTVWVLRDNVEIELALLDVRKDDVVALQSGEMIPVDGVIVEGMATIDQHVLTGESVPVEREKGDQVFSSTLIINGKIQVRVNKAGKDSTIAKISEILDNTSHYTTSLQLRGERWANRIALPVVGLTLFTIPGMGLLAATTVLHSSFGNRLRVLTPLGTINYLHNAYSKGILIKDGRAIEELDNVDTILFDKTGTLTRETPEVRCIRTHDEHYSENDILLFAATAEHKLSHPLARAILRRAEEEQLELPAIDDSHYHAGYGITVTLDEQLIRVGSARFMQEHQIDITATMQSTLDEAHAQGSTLVFVALDGKIAGSIEVIAPLRPEITDILPQLRQRGIKHMAIVSGDHYKPVEKMAQELGMDSFYAEVLPEQKAEIVQRLQQQGKKVCFIGDGINDAIAMKTANVSVSLSGATNIATDTAQVVFMSGNLLHLKELFDTSRSLGKNLQRTMAIVMIPSFLSLGGALFLGLRLAGSYLINYGFFTLALGNNMYPRLAHMLSKRSGDKQSQVKDLSTEDVHLLPNRNLRS